MVKNKKLTEQQFLEERQEVLASWKTGNDPQLNLDEAVAFLKTVPAEKNFAIKLAKAKERGTRTLVTTCRRCSNRQAYRAFAIPSKCRSRLPSIHN